MIKLYSPRRARKIIARHSPLLAQIEAQYAVPRAGLQAVLFQEITSIDLLDPLADCAVRLHWICYALRKRMGGAAYAARMRVLSKKDSSTGYGQVFAATAIRALNFAAARGISSAQALSLPFAFPLDARQPDHLRYVWRRLHDDPDFNLRAAAFTLLCAADEMTGSTCFSAFTPQQLQLVFSRYNANTQHVTAYGQQVYRHYLAFVHDTHNAQGAFSA